MRVKLDENLGERGARILRSAGHDLATVAEQGMAGAQDRELINVCQSEGRCLVTLDRDFSNPFIFPPDRYSGIAVLKVADDARTEAVFQALQVLAVALNQADIRGKLWSVSTEGYREWQPRVTEDKE